MNESDDADDNDKNYNDAKIIRQLMMMNHDRKVNSVKLSVVQSVCKVKQILIVLLSWSGTGSRKLSTLYLFKKQACSKYNCKNSALSVNYTK